MSTCTLPSHHLVPTIGGVLVAIAVSAQRSYPHGPISQFDDAVPASEPLHFDTDAYQPPSLFRTLYPNGLAGPPRRPAATPIRVYFGIELEEVRSIDAADRRFYARGFLWMYWEDERANLDRTMFSASSEHADSDWSLKWHADALRARGDVWDPQFAFVNADSDLELAMETFEVFPQKVGVRECAEVEYWCQFSGWFSDRANLLTFHDFPFDTQPLSIDVVTAYSSNIVEFAPCYETTDEDADAAARALIHPEWIFVDHRFEVGELAYMSEFGRPFSLARTTFLASRLPGHHVMSLGLPVAIIMVVFNCVIWIRPSQFEAKLGGAITCLLSLIAFSFVVNAEVPQIPYLTALGWYINTGYVVIVSGTVLVILGQGRLEALHEAAADSGRTPKAWTDRIFDSAVRYGPFALNVLSFCMLAWLLVRWLLH